MLIVSSVHECYIISCKFSRKGDRLFSDLHDAQHLLRVNHINEIKSETHPPKPFLLLTGELVAWWAADSLPVAPSETQK